MGFSQNLIPLRCKSSQKNYIFKKKERQNFSILPEVFWLKKDWRSISESVLSSHNTPHPKMVSRDISGYVGGLSQH